MYLCLTILIVSIPFWYFTNECVISAKNRYRSVSRWFLLVEKSANQWCLEWHIFVYLVGIVLSDSYLKQSYQGLGWTILRIIEFCASKDIYEIYNMWWEITAFLKLFASTRHFLASVLKSTHNLTPTLRPTQLYLHCKDKKNIKICSKPHNYYFFLQLTSADELTGRFLSVSSTCISCVAPWASGCTVTCWIRSKSASRCSYNSKCDTKTWHVSTSCSNCSNSIKTMLLVAY